MSRSAGSGRNPNLSRPAVRQHGVITDDGYAEFGAFVAARQHRMLRAAYLVCGDRHLAEDLLQGALVKLALRWKHVRDGEPEAYLRTILYRDSVSWWRRHRREQPTSALPDTGRADHADAATLRLVFAEALGRLTRRQRAVLVLRFFEDLTEARTAEVLGVSVGTVKSQTSAALRRLRELAPELSELVETNGVGR